MVSTRPLGWTLVLTLALSCGTAAVPTFAGHAGKVRVQAFELLNEGVSAYNRGEYALAAEKLNASAAVALSSFRAHFYLGLALIGDRRYLEAREALAVALDLDPDHLQSIVAFGDTHLKVGDINEAMAAYTRALKVRPAYARALDGIARSYEAKAQTETAIASYRKAIFSDPGFAPAYTHLGDLYLRQDRVREAVRLLEEAITIRPDFAPGLNRLALAYGRLGLHNEAASTVLRAIELEPTVADHPATLGWIQLGQGLAALAEGSFHRSLELDEAFPEARRGLAEVARRRGHYEIATAEIDAALEDPRLDASTERGLRKYREKLESEAARVAELEASVDAGEATEEGHGTLAAIYAGRSEWEAAIELQELAGDTPEQRERLAYMLLKAGRVREAQRIYAELSENFGVIEHELNSGIALALLGNDTAAIETYRSVLSRQPDNGPARLYLANAQLRIGRRKDAAASYHDYLQDNAEGAAGERVRRILRQIAPDLLPPEAQSALPDEPPQAPEQTKTEESS